MKTTALPYPPVEGKTFSLFGGTASTETYYRKIRQLADTLTTVHDPRYIVEVIRRYSGRRAWLKKQAGKENGSIPIASWLHVLGEELSAFTVRTPEHLEQLGARKRIFDRRLATTVEQYHLYMLEIELNNRLNREAFISAERKVALLPHCLRDFKVKCKAAKNGFDVQCRHCSSHCYQNRTSMLLSENGIEPYIWMGSNLKKLAREVISSNKSLGILGIACIPELTFGLRKVSAYDLPAVGLPLDANRCIRWFGEFHPNSINLEELQKLVRA